MMGALQLLLAVVCVVSLAGYTYGSSCSSAHWGLPDDGSFRPQKPIQIPPGRVENEIHIPMMPITGCQVIGIHYGVCEYDAKPVIQLTNPPYTIKVIRRGDVHLPAQLYHSIKCKPLVPHAHRH